MPVVQRAAGPRGTACCIPRLCGVLTLGATRGRDGKRHKAGLKSLIPRSKAAMEVGIREGHTWVRLRHLLAALVFGALQGVVGSQQTKRR